VSASTSTEDIVGAINIDGEVFEHVEARPSDRFDGWVSVGITHRESKVTYHLPPERIRWVQEGSAHGPLR
jgi:hypothetical protein